MKTKYLITFLNNFRFSYVQVYNTSTNESQFVEIPYAIVCTHEPTVIIDKVLDAINGLVGNESPENISFYSSVLAFEFTPRREALMKLGKETFAEFIIEPDWLNIHRSNLANRSAILLILTNGFSVSYSDDDGETINSMHSGYGFPLSDEAGDVWLGRDALVHALHVQEGIEERTLLSDKILAGYQFDADSIVIHIYENYIDTYLQAANVVKELAGHTEKATEMMQNSYSNIRKYIARIDELAGKKLPIYLAGDFSYLYKDFIPKDRLNTIDYEYMLKKQHDYARMKLVSAE